MNAAKQATWLFLLLALLAYSGWYFARTNITHKLDDHALATIPDAVIHQLTVRQFGENGQLVNQLQTPLLSHIPQNDTHFLEKPDIVITQINQPAWYIQSEKAVALNRGKQITFSNNVIIHQNRDKHAQESTLRTEEITYFPESKKATTSLLVTLEQPGTLIQSIGMNAYLAEKRVELLHQARGQYAPARG
ncbi:LPS export ABC transporter periplasmic protein LptC [Legionella israelensis]|uniref:LPS export ABC transporter periplasmic protein LptC n=1 Tax=Legionella israelensis TaxID=454 RepID=UPI00117D64D6|nr:LPS export ABC transporter periplasmic protein LptC [Legionella israelensis]QDP73045.1 LPS export ABC transporter periplasmic protein LptC [Legionella israelensis]